MAGDDGAAVIGGEGIAETGGFSADRHYRREGIFATRIVVGTGVHRCTNSDG